jgi:ABC-2 type transport system ATP-binding protein
MRMDDVWLRYRRRTPWVLRGITVRLDAGEAATVAGRNGVGKSTLLRLAAGLLRPDRGTVLDRPARIGYVPERFPAGQPFTARHYLTALAAVRGRPDAGALADWAERLHFTTMLNTPLSELSKGSAQKVGLIQALMVRPDFLVLDEPWEGLDAATRAEIPLIVAEVVAGGGRVLISDHSGGTPELPGMRRWQLTDGQVTEVTAAGPADCVVEVAMAAADVPAAVASLRAAGHRVMNVRVRGEEGKS